MRRIALTVWAVAVVTCAACQSGATEPDMSDLIDAGTDAIDPQSSVGCGKEGMATGTVTETVTVEGVARTYILVVPTNYDPMRAYPLIFAWHGRTGTAALARSYFGIQAVVGDNAILVYPQGLSVSNDPADTGWILTATGRDIVLFDTIQSLVRSGYCTGRTYSMGHSFGGYMSNALACYRGGTAPGKVRAIAAIAGGGPFGACSGDPISALIIHGMSDTVVPFAEGTGSRDIWRTDAACAMTTQPITPSPCVAYDGCAAGLAVRFCAHNETAGGGHGWPSFAPGAAWQMFQDSN